MPDKKRKRQTKTVTINDVDYEAYKYEGDDNWVIDGIVGEETN